MAERGEKYITMFKPAPITPTPPPRADFCPRLIYHSNVTKEFLSNEKKQVRDDKNVFLMAYIRTRSETLLVV